MFDRFRLWFASLTGRSNRTRRISRREREEAQRRLLIIGVSITALVLVVVLSAGAFYQYIYYPGQTMAAVDGVKISRSDYWKVRKLDLINQINQYSQIAQYATGSQQTQYQNLAQQAQAQLKTVESDSVDATTLKDMVDSQLVLKGMSQLGLSVTNAALDQYQAQQFSPAPIGSPTPTLPIDPTAAAWATATAQAQATASAATAAAATAAARATAAALGTPTVPATPVATTTTPSATATASGAASPSSTESASGTPSASPAAGTPAAPSPTPTLAPDAAQATAQATFTQYTNVVLKQAGMSVADFRRLILKPSLARQEVSNKLESEVPTRAVQIHAEHILVATQDAANAIVNDALKTKSFEEVAKAQSADSTTAANGGDLGWIPQGIMTPEFDKVAFALKVGEVSKPFQTPFGWEIVKVVDRQEDRPITTTTLTQLRNSKLNDWLDQLRAKASITWSISAKIPSPTPQTSFNPPPDAPPTPTPLPTPTPTPGPPATPGATPAGVVTPTP